MRVAIAHYSAVNDVSGVTTWLTDLCRSLIDSGHSVFVHLHHIGKNPAKGSIIPVLKSLGVNISSRRCEATLTADINNTLQFLNECKPDVFLPQCRHAHYCAAAIAGNSGLPWIFVFHSDDTDYWCVMDELAPWKNNGVTVCVSKFIGERAEKKYRIPSPQIIPYGVSTTNASTSFSQPFRVVYSGRLVNHQKRIVDVVKTLIRVCQLSPDTDAILLGDGSERRLCEKMVSQAGLSRRIRFQGRLEPSEVRLILKSCHAILLMSDFEGLPVALLEAMSQGVVPVVRSIDSGISELVIHEQTGLLVNNDPDVAAEAIVRLAKDKALWSHCSENSKVLARNNYSAAESIRRLTDLIETCGAKSDVQFPVGMTPASGSFDLNSSALNVQYSNLPVKSKKYHAAVLIDNLLNRIMSTFSGSRV
jgi:glycosyltransferase involved in cell wall biosynthesis